jgi:hypothetical protein
MELWSREVGFRIVSTISILPFPALFLHILLYFSCEVYTYGLVDDLIFDCLPRNSPNQVLTRTS